MPGYTRPEHAMEALVNWGIGLILALQALPWLAGPMLAVTWLGSEEFFLLVMPALYWCVNRQLGLGLAVTLISSNALNQLFKLGLHLPRPYWVDARVQALSSETTYGLPSGHAQNAAAIWGYLASQVRSLRPAVAWGLALALVAVISLSRVVLGMHFPMDVLGGWLVGGALLWAVLRWQAPVAARLAALSLGQQMVVAGLVSAVYVALGVALLAVVGAAPDPAAWQANAALSQAEPIVPRDSEAIANAGGMLLGLGAGLALAHRYARFDAGGPWGKRAARFIIGVIGMLLCWRGLALIFPNEPEAIDFVFRYVRYALTVLWAIYLAPWVFVRVGLAEEKVPVLA
jgi:membrane-associated phospholipid phosphatase